MFNTFFHQPKGYVTISPKFPFLDVGTEWHENGHRKSLMALCKVASSRDDATQFIIRCNLAGEARVLGRVVTVRSVEHLILCYYRN